MRPWVTISPLSRTVVSRSSSSATALTSSAYFFCGALARVRSQSGVAAEATGEPRRQNRSDPRNVLVAGLRTCTSALQNRLLFIAGLDLVEEGLGVWIHLHRDIDAVEEQRPLCYQMRAVKPAHACVAGYPRRPVVLEGDVQVCILLAGNALRGEA